MPTTSIAKTWDGSSMLEAGWMPRIKTTAPMPLLIHRNDDGTFSRVAYLLVHAAVDTAINKCEYMYKEVGPITTTAEAVLVMLLHWGRMENLYR